MIWKSPIVILDGIHKGEITHVEVELKNISKDKTKEDMVEYVYTYIKPENVDLEMKYSTPANLSPNTKLGRLCQRMGAKFESGKDLNIKELLAGKKVIFMTMIKKSTKDGREYAEIIEDSIKPEIEVINMRYKGILGCHTSSKMHLL